VPELLVVGSWDVRPKSWEKLSTSYKHFSSRGEESPRTSEEGACLQTMSATSYEERYQFEKRVLEAY
jgi:hypothetical protein